MKTRRQKVFAILSACFLCASFFAVPVSAVDEMETFEIKNEIYNYGVGPGGNYDPNYKPFSSLKYLNGEDDLDDLDFYVSDEFEEPVSVVSGVGFMDFEIELDDNYGLFNYYINDLPSGLSITDDDTFFIDAGSILISLDNDNFTLSQYRFSIRSGANNSSFDFGEVVAATDIFDIDYTSNTRRLSYPQMFFDVYEEMKPTRDYCLCLEFYASLEGDGIGSISFKLSGFSVKFGVGVSPDYPIYPSAPGGDDVGNLDSAEQELIQGSQQGLNNAADNFASFGDRIRSFSTCFLRIGSYLNRIVGNTPYLDLVVWISLSLGIYASLLGLAGAIVSAADRKAGREAAAEKRKSKK